MEKIEASHVGVDFTIFFTFTVTLNKQQQLDAAEYGAGQHERVEVAWGPWPPAECP